MSHTARGRWGREGERADDEPQQDTTSGLARGQEAGEATSRRAERLQVRLTAGLHPPARPGLPALPQRLPGRGRPAGQLQPVPRGGEQGQFSRVQLSRRLGEGLPARRHAAGRRRTTDELRSEPSALPWLAYRVQRRRRAGAAAGGTRASSTRRCPQSGFTDVLLDLAGPAGPGLPLLELHDAPDGRRHGPGSAERDELRQDARQGPGRVRHRRGLQGRGRHRRGRGGAAARSSSSSRRRRSSAGSAAASPRACCWWARRAPARRCWPARWRARRACRSSASPAPSSWRCSSAWAPPACATCSPRPRQGARASSSSTSWTPSARAATRASLGGHDEREQTLNQLLAEMDGFDSQRGPHHPGGHQPPGDPGQRADAPGPLRPAGAGGPPGQAGPRADPARSTRAA